ncbi:MAG: hypothetical protein GYA50_06235, partial [Eubacteriaceae bacterium]|nr:hypothetical protein [Eubacteriaceae bacterium]
FKNEIEEIKKYIEVSEDESIYTELEFILVFIKNIEDIEKYSEIVLPRVSANALIWFAFPKNKPIDDGWEIVRDYQFEPIRQITISNEWSAMRFRPNKLAKSEEGGIGQEEKIKTKKKIEFY